MAEGQRSLRILQVSTTDMGGGAEGSAWNLFQAYRERGHCSRLAVGRKRSDDPYVLEIPNDRFHSRWARLWNPGDRLLQSFQDKIRGIGLLRRPLRVVAEPHWLIQRWQGIEDFDFPGTHRLLELPPEPPDIVHCHNLHGGYFDLRALPWLSHQVPVILNLRDAWLLGGHCAHSFDCDRWKTGCGQCPDLTIYPAIRRDATALNWRRKSDIYAKSWLYITTNSHWLMDKVRQSMLHGVEYRVIPNGIDLTIFHPGEQAAARASLGLPSNSKIVLFASNRVRRNPWRDYATMEAAIQQVATQSQYDKLIFVCLGEKGLGQRWEEYSLGQACVRFVAFERDPKRVARYYQAADVYIHAAKAEAFGKTVTEALACGKPVVATAVGGIPEQVDDGVTGFLTPPGDAVVMAERISQLLRDDELCRRIGFEATQSARSRFGLERQANDFLMWYNEILEHWRGERLIAKSR